MTSILLVLAWPTNRKSTQNKEMKNSESNIKQEILHIGTGIILSSRHREGFNYTLAKRSMMQLSVTDVKGLYTSMLILEKILNSVSIFKLYLNSVGQYWTGELSLGLLFNLLGLLFNLKIIYTVVKLKARHLYILISMKN